jgi:hypothetical protein
VEGIRRKRTKMVGMDRIKSLSDGMVYGDAEVWMCEGELGVRSHLSFGEKIVSCVVGTLI